MARPPAGRPSADEPDQPDDETAALDDDGASEDDPAEDDPAEDDDADADLGDDDDDDSAEAERTRTADRFWTSVRIDPIEIALPGGVGYTLRAYRQNTDVTPADVSAREDEVPLPRRQVATVELDEDEDQFDDDLQDVDAADEDEPVFDEEDEEPGEDEDEEDEDAEASDEVVEEVPIFLSQSGHLLLFRSAESLVDFVLSDAEHDLQQLDTWESATRSIRPEYVVSLPDDTYELDLVVKNLRGGHDAWDPQLIVRSGQLARDLGHALRVEPVMQALAPGSPLDDLDEALRDVAAGGFGSFFARRRLKKVGAQTATLGWRTVVGKISAVVDWRD